MISEVLLDELKMIFEEEFGIKLSKTQTKDIASFLVTWFQSLL